MHTFYSNTGFSLDSIVQLPEQESIHAVKVLRLKEQTIVRLINGKGSIASAEIITAHPKKSLVKIIEINSVSQPFKKAIAIAPTKTNDRIEWFLEKATEIGITDFYPFISKNSERKKINLERWKKVVLAAVKQSQRAWLPQIHQLQNLDEVLKLDGFQTKMIAHCFSSEKNNINKVDNNSILLIGPEGDFSPDEVEKATSLDYAPVSLGENRLRTETAGVVGATLMCY